mgnify:CR=1 FL=1
MQRKVIAGIVMAVFLLSVIAAGLLARNVGTLASVDTMGDIGVINIGGVITTGSSQSSIFSEVSSGSGDINRQIRKAADNPNLKAVILRLNSPGGTVAGTQEISREIDKLKKSGKKVVASMGDVAASGAYWLAARCDKIVANPGTMTGSIGVIMSTQNLEGLYEMLGVKQINLKKGKHKDMGSAAREMTEEEKAILQSMIDDDYDHFVQAVAEGRDMNVARVRELATGRVFNGSQAKEVGLVDEMGNFYDAVDLTAKLAGIKGEPNVVNIEKEKGWLDVLGNVKLDSLKDSGLQHLLQAYPTTWLIYSPALEAEVRYDG